VEAFVKAKDLETLLEDYLMRAHQIRTNKKQIFLGAWGIVATVIACILGSLLLI